ncbi:serine/threonine-protein kinase [Larkinella soli]|uniref:serine/threonine-protein kinase n=1 Tax=Larkinella soli TaxID=1770527 RepID=UPI000FFB59B9|nr:serine/threonine-protein kinase [Larkinella soli]
MAPHPLLHTSVSGFRLTEFVGAGGMGEVFRAQHPVNGTAAVKVLYRPEFVARFRNEAYVQASISHPNIAALYEYALAGDRPALVMEWVDGQQLDDLIRRKERLGNNDARQILSQIAGAVAFLHRSGIVHRDLKPSNIRVRPNGQVKLLDFGIARSQYSPRLTQVGHVVGTSEYMAPEQFRNQGGLPSDVWSMGVLLYEMTTGHLPFDAAHPAALRRSIERGQFTNPRLLNPALSPQLAALMVDCLQNNPARRPTAEAIVERLSGGDAGGTTPHRESGIVLRARRLLDQVPVRLSYLPAGAGLVLAVLFLIGWGKKPDGTNTTETGPATRYEQIEVEVVNADFDLQMILPDGSVQTREPFIVRRIPGRAVPITIRHRGAEQQFVIDPEVRQLYKCFFDR